MTKLLTGRQYPIGAEIIADKGVHFRVWSPENPHVTLILHNTAEVIEQYPLIEEEDAPEFYSVLVPTAKAGTLYNFTLLNNNKLLSDPASRFQPVGPSGPSCVIDPSFNWTDENWPGLDSKNQILYELHIGTFTTEGTFAAAALQLPALAELGITAIELMPINDFDGNFGWGYDGVNLFAPSHLYGTPQEVKAFINQAHHLGIGVILDVVYNHLGPEGNHLKEFTSLYFNENHTTDWGEAINFDLPASRNYFLTNVKYWIAEFHFDGLRIDATPTLFSTTSTHILADLASMIKNSSNGRKTWVIGENEEQNTKLLHPLTQQGYGFDALWNDDFHHSACVRITGNRDAYFTDYLGTPQEFISTIKYGFLYQGQYYDWQKKNRGVADFNLSKQSFIIYLENHDQIANILNGRRLHQLADPGIFRAFTVLLLLSPNTPMLFQGQEFGSSKPFYYFADHTEKINKLVYEGRCKFLSQAARIASVNNGNILSNPADLLTFTGCKLDHQERIANKLYQLHKDLISLRKTDPVFITMQEGIKIDGAVLNADAFILRYFGGEELGDRLFIFNFGADYYANPAPEPLLAAGDNLEWEILLSSESINYGGSGTPPINKPYWKILGHSAMVFKTVKR